MKKILLTAALFIIISNSLHSQLNLVKDSFVFRNDIAIEYNLYLKSNDPNPDSLRIISFTKIGSNSGKYSLSISADSSFVGILSSDNTLDTASFYYTVVHKNGMTDSALVFFQRLALTPDIYPGDCNRDNSVNHFDIFPIGILFGKTGNPRHLQDTSLSFTLKAAHAWNYSAGPYNGKFSDVDGNGVISIRDFSQYSRNLGKSSGNYTPLLSSNSSSVQLKASIADTIDIFSSTGVKNIPIVIVSPTTINSYGIGYSYTMRSFNRSNGLDSFYPHTRYLNTNIWFDQTNLFALDTLSFAEHKNVAYCRINGSNGGMDGQAGVVEVVVDEVLLGLASSGDLPYLTLQLKEVALIDNIYNMLPITAVSKRIYFRKASSRLINGVEEVWNVYPTMFDKEVFIEKATNKEMRYTVLNSIGVTIESGVIKFKTKLNTTQWPAGVYYLKLDSSAEVYKIQKN